MIDAQKRQLLNKKAYASTQGAGFSLLEILIVLTLFSVSLIALCQVQNIALHRLQDAAVSGQVIVAHIGLSERLRSCLGDRFCQNAQIQQWKQETKLQLPNKEHLTASPKGPLLTHT